MSLMIGESRQLTQQQPVDRCQLHSVEILLNAQTTSVEQICAIPPVLSHGPSPSGVVRRNALCLADLAELLHKVPPVW